MRSGPGTVQWTCHCGWSNFTVRKSCRNCGTGRPLNLDELADRIAAKTREIESQVDVSHWRKYQQT